MVSPESSFPPAKTANELIEQVLTFRTVSNLTTDKTREDLYWYRGHANQAWQLQPSALRAEFTTTPRTVGDALNGIPAASAAENWTRELRLNVEFKRRGAAFLDRTDAPSVYIAARHHGLPSRLLDWTTDPLVALFFACESVNACSEESGNPNGEVIAWSPVGDYYYDHPDRTRGPLSATARTPVVGRHPCFTQQLPALFEEQDGSWSTTTWEDRSDVDRLGGVLPVLPDLSIARMIGQMGAFTFHPRGSRSLTLDVGHRITVPDMLKRGTRSKLAKLGVSWSRIDPGLDGIVRELMAPG